MLPGREDRNALSIGKGERVFEVIIATILTALANLLPMLPEEEAYLALFHGARRVAADCDGQAPRRERASLGSHPDAATLKRWLRRWTNVPLSKSG
jgi:hypothetical protein